MFHEPKLEDCPFCDGKTKVYDTQRGRNVPCDECEPTEVNRRIVGKIDMKEYWHNFIQSNRKRV